MNDHSALFERFEIDLTREQAEHGSHPGQCYPDILDLLGVPEIAAQLDKIGLEAIKAELKEYGAWDEAELSDDQENRARILWIACGNIKEDIREKESR